MKKFLTKKGFIIILGFTIGFSIIIGNFVAPPLNKAKTTISKIDNIELKTVGYWNLTGSPIFIDDSDPNCNWSKTALENEWCSGSGTWNDPYLIENVTINGLGTGSCIAIKNSENVYFIIKNCSIYNSGGSIDDAGIKLEGTNNGTLINNTCRNCHAGIYLYQNSDNNTLIKNLARNNLYGIDLWAHCDNNKILENIVINNRYLGIEIYHQSHNNCVFKNYLENNWEPQWWCGGIMIESSSYNKIIENTIINNRENGISVYADYCYDNIINNNNISGNNVGIRMSYSVLRINIIENLIKDNNYGIWITNSQPSESNIYLNWFIDNGIQAYDNSNDGDNNWDNGTIGNFWSDYPGVDADDNGIGDTPYLIGGDYGGDQDNYPIWYDSPNIKINSPQDLEIFETTAPSFNVEITDPNMDEMWYTLNYGIQKVLFTTNESINQGIWDSLPDGPIIITFYANDTAGNLNSSTVMVIKDTGSPSIIINNPHTNDVFGTTAPTFNVEIADFLLNTTWYTIDNGITNITFTSNTSINQGLWNNAFDGPITITFYANDTLGKLNFNAVLVYKDTAYPEIYIFEPEWDEEFGETAPNFIVQVIEANVIELWYTIDSGLHNYTFTTNNTINQAVWDAIPEGNITFMVFVKDIAGNINYDQVRIIKFIEEIVDEDEIILGYNYLVLLGLVCIISTILIMRLKKSYKTYN